MDSPAPQGRGRGGGGEGGDAYLPQANSGVGGRLPPPQKSDPGVEEVNAMSEQVIHVLPKALCDQLAAGEVLERASSAVKELVENALDAGADEIEIELEEAGRKRLCVCDNGCGMSPEDAKVSILRHATSKIHRSEDLASISTMGFRGEALASMAAVSRLSLTTQRRGDALGTYLHVEGSEVTEFRETAAPAGTQIVLEDLFFNTPARLKFLKTAATEMRRVYEVVESFALACHEVRWKLTFDGRVKCEFPKHRTLGDRALAVFGRTLYEHLYPITYTILGDVTVDGLYCAPDFVQSSAGRIYTFVNRRIVRDKTINGAISQAYKEFLHGRQPCVVLFLTIPLDLVDVNVHPTKHEIRFQSPDVVFRAVYRALRQSLEKTPWIRSERGEESASLPESAFRPPEDNLSRDYGLSDPFAYQGRRASSEVGECVVSRETERKVSEALSFFDELVAPPEAPSRPEVLTSVGTQVPLALGPSVVRDASEASGSRGYFSNLTYIGQYALTYLICADGDNLVLIDQHAAHERINYERLKKVADDVLPVSSQGLLFPLLLSLDGRLSDLLVEYQDFFEKIGFQIDDLGNHTHAIRAVPESLVNYDYQAIVRDALLDLGESGRATQFEDIRDNILATMACHKSIRAGQKLSPSEVAELFRLMDETGFRSNCPHGRPVHFVITRAELEKRFLRTGFVK